MTISSSLDGHYSLLYGQKVSHLPLSPIPFFLVFFCILRCILCPFITLFIISFHLCHLSRVVTSPRLIQRLQTLSFLASPAVPSSSMQSALTLPPVFFAFVICMRCPLCDSNQFSGPTMTSNMLWMSRKGSTFLALLVWGPIFPCDPLVSFHDLWCHWPLLKLVHMLHCKTLTVIFTVNYWQQGCQ